MTIENEVERTVIYDIDGRHFVLMETEDIFDEALTEM